MRFILAILMVTLFAISFGESKASDWRCNCKAIKNAKGLSKFCNTLASDGNLDVIINYYYISPDSGISTCQNRVKSDIDKTNCITLVGKFPKCTLTQKQPTPNKNLKGSHSY